MTSFDPEMGPPLYSTDSFRDGQVVAMRLGDWKGVFLENHAKAFEVWREPFTQLHIPLLLNLRQDPFEKAQPHSNTYNDWFLERSFVAVSMQQVAAEFLATMKEYPPVNHQIRLISKRSRNRLKRPVGVDKRRNVARFLRSHYQTDSPIRGVRLLSFNKIGKIANHEQKSHSTLTHSILPGNLPDQPGAGRDRFTALLERGLEQGSDS